MHLSNNIISNFINNTSELNYRGCVEPINSDLARNLVEQFGSDNDFIAAVPTVRSVGIEGVIGFNNSDDLLDFFDEHKDELLLEMALIHESIIGRKSTAIDYIENNTDCEYTKDEIESALAESDAADYYSCGASENRIAVAGWVCHQAASELCANYVEYVKIMDNIKK